MTESLASNKGSTNSPVDVHMSDGDDEFNKDLKQELQQPEIQENEDSEQLLEQEQNDEEVEEAEKPPGNSLTLPIARVKRIIKQDDDVAACATSAVYAIGSATELFIQYLTEQALLRTRIEKRKRVSYDDVSEAVSSVDQLQFLTSKFVSFASFLLHLITNIYC